MNDKKIIVYSTATCGYCQKLKQFLEENNIAFEYVDVAANPEKGQEMIEKSGQMGVPVIDIDGNIIVGFEKNRIAELLGI